MKKHVKLLVIFASVMISIPSLAFLSFAIYLLIETNIEYTVHLPSLMHQTRYVLKKNGEVIYLDRLEAFIRSYSNDNYKPFSFFHKDTKLSSTGNNSIAYSEKYLAFSGSLDSSSGTTKYIQVYNEDYTLLKEFSGSGFYDAVFYDDSLYYTDFNKQLVKYDISNDAVTIIAEDLAPNLSFFDGDHYLDIGRNYVFFNYYFDNKSLLHSYFIGGSVHLYCKNFDLCIDHNRLSINGVVYEQDDCFFNYLYENAYLIDDKVVFATFNKKENNKCGSKTDNCICRFGCSFLFSYDLKTKQINLLKEYADGTYLIDYDLNDTKYYYQGSLYVNDTLCKKCEIIEPSEMKTIKGGRYLPSDTGRPFYLSYYDGEFYGA